MTHALRPAPDPHLSVLQGWQFKVKRTMDIFLLYTPPGDSKFFYSCGFVAELYRQQKGVLSNNEIEIFTTEQKKLSKAVNIKGLSWLMFRKLTCSFDKS
jgi:hypothetical protein